MLTWGSKLSSIIVTNIWLLGIMWYSPKKLVKCILLVSLLDLIKIHLEVKVKLFLFRLKVPMYSIYDLLYWWNLNFSAFFFFFFFFFYWHLSRRVMLSRRLCWLWRNLSSAFVDPLDPTGLSILSDNGFCWGVIDAY